MNNKKCYTALITPFKNGQLDEDALIKILQFQEQQGIDGIVLCGTTGEVDLVNINEYARILELGVQTVKIPIIAGVGSPSTIRSVEMALMAQKIGVHTLLAVTPYYVVPTSEGIFAHYQAIHDATNLPLIVYSNPRRTGFEIGEHLLEDILKLERVVGMKDSTSDQDRIQKIGSKFQGTSFEYICGEDSKIDSFLEAGARGWVCVISNLYPKECADIMQGGEHPKVALTLESLVLGAPNPVPIKYAVNHLLKLCDDEVRLPLLPLTLEQKQEFLKRIGLE